MKGKKCKVPWLTLKPESKYIKLFPCLATNDTKRNNKSIKERKEEKKRNTKKNFPLQ